jgi:glycine cleavage system regulatory protein
MSTSIVLTVIGEDQPGIVKALSEVLTRHGGNWTQSNMSSLAGKFAGILLATLPESAVDACIADLEKLGEQGLQVIAHTSGGEAADGANMFVLDLIGHDRPGIVKDITQVLARHGVSVHELETEVASASMAGGPLFKARAVLKVPEGIAVRDLEVDLEAIANELMVEFRRER